MSLTANRTWAPYQDQVEAEMGRIEKRSRWITGVMSVGGGGSVGVLIGLVTGGSQRSLTPFVVTAAVLVVCEVLWFVWLFSLASHRWKRERARKRVARAEGLCWYCLAPGWHRPRVECGNPRRHPTQTTVSPKPSNRRSDA